MTRASRAGIWIPGLVVTVAAAAATAHGLYEVAVGAGTPPAIACLYPVITDGLALVAYASTSRLAGPGRRYAWAVVVLAAGLSGLAQATYLAGAVEVAPAGLRFGVGAWPAIAAAVAAHLLFLIGSGDEGPALPLDASFGERPGADRSAHPGVQPAVQPGVQVDHSAIAPAPAPGAGLAPGARALDTARSHRRRHGRLPSVRELEAAAGVSRGTAHAALQELRAAENGYRVAEGGANDPDQGLKP